MPSGLQRDHTLTSDGVWRSGRCPASSPELLLSPPVLARSSKQLPADDDLAGVKINFMT